MILFVVRSMIRMAIVLQHKHSSKMEGQTVLTKNGK
jgi:hypothetical protein